MKLLKSLFTLIAVVVVGILVYFFVYRVEQERKQRMLEERRLIRFDLDKIKSFTLVRPDSSVVFERGVGRIWNITSPVKCEADKEPIFELFYSLDASDILYEVENNPKDLSVYDLERPQYYMAMEYEVGDPDTLFLGSYTPDSTMTYVRFASEDRVLAVNNHVTDLLKRPVLFYRSRSMLNVVADDIVGIEIQRTQKYKDKIVLQYNGIAWVMKEPWEHPADQSNMEDFCEKIADARKNTLVEEKTDDLSRYGLDNPNTVLQVHLRYGMPSKMILIGNKLTERGKTHLWYAKQFDNDLIFTVENSVVTAMNRTPVWFIDKHPVKINRTNVNRIVLETTREPITFVRDAANNWSVVSPVDKNVEQNTINNIFSISRFLLAHDIFAYDPTPEDIKKAGLDNPRITLSFYNGDRLLSKVFFGKSFTTNRENTYFRTNLSPIIYISRSSVNSSINTVLDEVFGG